MKLIVCMLNNYKFPIFVDEEYCILDLKEKIEYQIGVPVNEQRLIILGRGTEDGRKLIDYHVQENTIVHLAVRLRHEEESKQNE